MIELNHQQSQAVEREAVNADWKPVAEAPEGVEVMTKIDDVNGARNVCTLKRSGRLWFRPDGSSYVYYTPTHFAFIS